MEQTSVRRSARNHASSRAAAAQEEQARAPLGTRAAAPSSAQQQAANTVDTIDEQQLVERPRRWLRGMLRADQQAPRSIVRLPGSTASIPPNAFRTPDNTASATLVDSPQTNVRTTSISDAEDATFADRDERLHPPQWTVV